MEIERKKWFYFIGALLLVGIISAVTFSGSFTVDLEQSSIDDANAERADLNMTLQDYINYKVGTLFSDSSEDRNLQLWLKEVNRLQDTGNKDCMKEAYLCVRNVNNNCGS